MSTNNGMSVNAPQPLPENRPQPVNNGKVVNAPQPVPVNAPQPVPVNVTAVKNVAAKAELAATNTAANVRNAQAKLPYTSSRNIKQQRMAKMALRKNRKNQQEAINAGLVPAECRRYGSPSPPSADGSSIRLYKKQECDTLGGTYAETTKECLRPEGGSFSWDCRMLNPQVPMPVPMMPSPEMRVRVPPPEMPMPMPAPMMPPGMPAPMMPPGMSAPMMPPGMPAPMMPAPMMPPGMSAPMMPAPMMPPGMPAPMMPPGMPAPMMPPGMNVNGQTKKIKHVRNAAKGVAEVIELAKGKVKQLEMALNVAGRANLPPLPNIPPPSTPIVGGRRKKSPTKKTKKNLRKRGSKKQKRTSK